MGEGLNEEQTATLETALLHAARTDGRAGPDANRSAGLQSCRVALDASSHQGLVELARRRSDLSVHLRFDCLRGGRSDQCMRVMAPPALELLQHLA